MKRFRFAFIFSLLIMLLALSGCGSKTENASNNASSSAPASQSTGAQEQSGNTANGQGAAVSQSTAPTTANQTPTNQAPKPQPAQPAPVAPQATTPVQQPQPTPKNPVVTITMADGGIIKAELYPQVAPNTVKNFIALIQKGLYNEKIFHRVIPKFMIQGGDPNGNGTGGPGYGIKGEFTANSFKNDLKHTRGVLSMARSSAPDSAGSQFFIMVADSAQLDGNYAAFGKVISGMETVDKIVNTARNQADKPLEDQKMKTVTVDTFGVNYGAPETIKK